MKNEYKEDFGSKEDIINNFMAAKLDMPGLSLQNTIEQIDDVDADN